MNYQHILKIKVLVTIVICSLLVLQPLSGQEYLIDHEYLTTEDGLANLYTTSIFQDSENYVWIASRYGLNRYNGYNFDLYTKEENGLFNPSNLFLIDEDDSDNLWLFYRDGLKEKDGLYSKAKVKVFDKQTKQAVSLETFFDGELPFDIEDLIHIKVVDAKQRIWLTTIDGGIYRVQNGKIETIYQNKESYLRCLAVDKENNIWAAYGKNVLKISSSGKLLQTFTFDEVIAAMNIGQNGFPYFLSLVGNGVYSGKVYQINENNQLQDISFYRLDGSKLSLTSKTNIEFHQDKNGIWYVSLNSDLYLFDKDFQEIQTEDIFTEFRPISFFSTLFLNDYLWITTGTGILKIKVKPNPFYSIKEYDTYDCRGITADENGQIYLLNGSIYELFPKNKIISEVYPVNGMGMLYTKDNLFFAGTYSRESFGSVYNRSTNQFHFLNMKDAPLIHAVLKWKNSEILVGTEEGLFFVDLKKQTVQLFEKYNEFNELQTTRINFFYESQSGIWITTTNGVYLLDKNKGIIQHFNSKNSDLPFDNIRHIHEDENGDFWLSTVGGGLIYWNIKNKEFQQFTTKEGLSHNYLYAAYGDDFGNLWISSDRGLMCFNKATKNIRTYLKEDGLPNNEFNFTSHYQAKDGALYFGTLEGFIAFHPKDFKTNFGYKTPLNVLALNVLEKDNEAFTDRTNELFEHNEIVIYSSDKFIELALILMDFDKAETHEYFYKIKGYSDIWTKVESNKIQITYLPYGNYTLEIKGKHIRKGWSSEVLNFPLTVVRPFYLRWWFIVLVGLGLILMISQFFKYRTQKLKRDAERLQNIIKVRTGQIERDKTIIAQQAEDLKALDVAKTRFFSNITHEFRTPLTLIIGPLKQYLQHRQSHQLSMVLKNAEQLQLLINQLLDISKLENQKMVIDYKYGDVVEYTTELVEQLHPICELKNQQLYFNHSLSTWKVNFDQDKWHKIIYNLLSNAVKFTPENGIIQLNLTKVKKEKQSFIALSIQDNGVGIAANRLTNIFNRFYQVDNSMTRKGEGTGIGLSLVKELVEVQNGTIEVISEVGKGTSFEINLPVILAKNVNEVQPNVSRKMPIMDNSIVTSPIIIEEATIDKLDILIIEDNADMRTYIKSCIDTSKYRVIEAHDGQDGIEKALEIIPDLIITDIMMPRKNGFEVISSIRDEVRTSHIPIVVLSAKAALESRLEGLRRGADVYLSKPFSEEELALSIQNLLQLRQLIQQQFQTGKVDKKTTKVGINTNIQQENKFLIKVNEVIFDNLQYENLTGEFVAQQLYLSRGHFYRKIKALTNQTANQYINTVRLNKAIPLLEKGNLTVSEIAYEVGFSSPSYFSRVCKRVYGKPPSEMARFN